MCGVSRTAIRTSILGLIIFRFTAAHVMQAHYEKDVNTAGSGVTVLCMYVFVRRCTPKNVLPVTRNRSDM